MSLLIIPIGPLISALGSWLQEMRQKLTRDSRNPYIKSDVKTIGFGDANRLPSPENDAVAIASARIDEKEYETAKHILINAWLLTPPGIAGENAKLRLKEGFVRLYQAKDDPPRAEKIAGLPILLLDSEIQWIVTHPDEQIGGTITDTGTEPQNPSQDSI